MLKNCYKKRNYSKYLVLLNLHYFQLIFDKVKSGGLIIIDNVLWKGKVYGNESDADTRSIRELNDHIADDTRVEKLILPVRDGIMLIRKK